VSENNGAQGRRLESISLQCVSGPVGKKFFQWLSAPSRRVLSHFGSDGMTSPKRRSQSLSGRTSKEGAREELAILVLVEPRALDVEQPQSGDEARERQCINRELCDRPVRAGVRLVIEDMDGAVPDLEKVEMTGDDARGAGVAGCNFDAELPL